MKKLRNIVTLFMLVSFTGFFTGIVKSQGPCQASISPQGDTTFCAGGNVVLDASSGASYQWQVNDTIITGATNSSYTASTSGSFTVMIGDGTGCIATSNPIIVTVNTAPVITIEPVSSDTVCSGGSTFIFVTATGSNLTYQWQVNSFGFSFTNLSNGSSYFGSKRRYAKYIKCIRRYCIWTQFISLCSQRFMHSGSYINFNKPKSKYSSNNHRSGRSFQIQHA